MPSRYAPDTSFPYFKKPLYSIAKTLYFYVVFAMECKNIVFLQHENKMELWNI